MSKKSSKKRGAHRPCVTTFYSERTVGWNELLGGLANVKTKLLLSGEDQDNIGVDASLTLVRDTVTGLVTLKISAN